MDATQEAAIREFVVGQRHPLARTAILLAGSGRAFASSRRGRPHHAMRVATAASDKTGTAALPVTQRERIGPALISLKTGLMPC